MILTLQNQSNWSSQLPTICIKNGDDGWAEAYQNWIDGKNPTDSPEWKKGVIATFSLDDTMRL